MPSRQSVDKFAYAHAVRMAYRNMRKSYEHKDCHKLLVDWFSNSVLSKESIVAIIEREFEATKSEPQLPSPVQ